MADSPLLTVTEACRYLRCSRDKLDEARKRGDITFIQLRHGGPIFFRQVFLDDYLARGTHRASPLGLNKSTFRKPRKK